MLELFHRGEFVGAAAGDLDQLAVAHAPHQRIAAAAGQTLAGVVEGQPRIAQRRRASGQPRVSGERMQGQHRLGRQLRAAQLAKDLRQRHARSEAAVGQPAAQALAVLVFQRRQLQPQRFFGGRVEHAQRGALGVEVPQAIDAQQPLIAGQLRQQALAAVGLHHPVPVERMRLAARQAQPGQAAQKARRGIQHFGQQGVADVATEPGVAAALAQALRQAEHGGGEALLVRLQRQLAKMLAVQRHRARVAAVLQLRQQHRRHVDMRVDGALFGHHFQKKAEHAVVFGGDRFGCGQQAPPRQRQRVLLAHGERRGLLFFVRLLHAHAVRGDDQNTELSSAGRLATVVAPRSL